MRKHFAANWAFGIKGAMEKVVRQSFPQDVRHWPLLQAFNFEGYMLDEKHSVIVLKDKLSGIPSGTDILPPFPHRGAPVLPPRVEEVPLWQFFFRNALQLRAEDAAFLIPVYDSGTDSALSDYGLFSTVERYFWSEQLRFVVGTYKTHLQTISNQLPAQPVHTTYNVSGTNSRVNINSADSSVNIFTGPDVVEVFKQVREAVAQIPNESERKALEAVVAEMQEVHGETSFLQKYQAFMELAANHATILAPIFVPLAGLLG